MSCSMTSHVQTKVKKSSAQVWVVVKSMFLLSTVFLRKSCQAVSVSTFDRGRHEQKARRLLLVHACVLTPFKNYCCHDLGETFGPLSLSLSLSLPGSDSVKKLFRISHTTDNNNVREERNLSGRARGWRCKG
jgi:hypothetical protein